MATPGSQYLPLDPNTRKPKEAPPPNSCDSQFHISGEGYKTREGATYHSVGATYQATCKMHEVLGIDRGIIVQSTVYATDHTIVLDALAALGRRVNGKDNPMWGLLAQWRDRHRKIASGQAATRLDSLLEWQ
jgi:hypothetical protein